MEKQNSKRVMLESYFELLEFEGRIYREDFCFICQQPLKKDITLMRAFKFTHPSCLYDLKFSKNRVLEMIENKESIKFEDNEIDTLFEVLKRGF